jgi:glycosyltransferase involved in cell wall biosynthesis
MGSSNGFMKIAHVVDSMEVGGAEMIVLQMSRLQRERGHDPRVYAITSLGAVGEQMRGEGFVVHSNIGKHLIDSMRAFLKLFKEWQPDVVHVHNPTPTIYAACAARMAGVRRVVSTRHSLVARPWRIQAEIKYGIACRFCDWVVGICNATTDNIRSLHSVTRKKIVRIYNGTIQVTEVESEARLAKAGFTLLYVGRLAAVKNHGLLLAAFSSALKSIPDLKLWMVGDGPERERLEQLSSSLDLSDAVTFWGQRLDVAPFFSAADAFIMSSRSEGLPMSLLQAFSAGLPAIVTNVGGMAEAVNVANAGRTVSSTDPDDMTAAILDIASQPAKCKQFGANAKSAFERHFTLTKMVEAYMALYQDRPPQDQ